MMRLWLLLICAALSQVALGNNSASEERMLRIATELRCLVCQNETVAASRSDFAVDIRELIRSQIKAGKTNSEIQEFLVSKYGDFILYRPPLKATTLLLWFGPLLLLTGGFLMLAVTLRRRRRTVVDMSLSNEEREMAEALLQHSTHHGGSS